MCQNQTGGDHSKKMFGVFQVPFFMMFSQHSNYEGDHSKYGFYAFFCTCPAEGFETFCQDSAISSNVSAGTPSAGFT